MAKKRHGATPPVAKKGGFLGKFVAFLLGFILGIGAIAGAVFGVISYVMSNTLHGTVGLLEGFVPGIYAMMFGSDGQNNGILDEKYANRMVGDLLGDSMTAISNIQGGTGSLKELGDIFPVIGNFTAQLVMELDAYSVPVDHETLMTTPLSGLKDYVMESVKNTALGDLLNGMNAEGEKGNNLMNAISYGEEGVDYTFDASGKVVMLNGAQKATLNDLITEGGMDKILNKIPLDSVITVETDDEVMCAIAYGSSARYGVDKDGKVYMTQVTYTYEDKGDGFKFYDDKDNVVEGKYERITKTKTRIIFADGETQYVKIDENNLCKAYEDEALSKPILYKKTKIGDLSKDSMAIINNIYLKDALSVDASAHSVLISLAYGKEGVDFKYVGEGDNREIVMIGNAKPRTIGDLRERGGSLIDDIPLTDITTEDRDSGLIMYLLYGREGVHYQINTTTDKVVMLQKHIAISQTKDGVKVYNEYGELLSGYQIDTKAKLYTDANGNAYTYAVGTHASAITSLETEDGEIVPVYYLSNENGAALYTKTTLGDLAGSSNMLSNLTSRITVGEVMDGETVESNKFFKHVLDKTIDELPDAINGLTLQTVYSEEIFQTDDNGNFLDKNGNITTSKDEYVAEHEWWYLLHDKAVCESEHGKGCDKQCVQDYAITEMDVLISNMRANIEMATLFQLKADGMIDGLDDKTLNSSVRTSISGVTLEMGDLPQGEGVKLGDYTVVQMLNYVNAIFEAIDKIENGG